jgi:hypothetical protein
MARLPAHGPGRSRLSRVEVFASKNPACSRTVPCSQKRVSRESFRAWVDRSRIACGNLCGERSRTRIRRWIDSAQECPRVFVGEGATNESSTHACGRWVSAASLPPAPVAAAVAVPDLFGTAATQVDDTPCVTAHVRCLGHSAIECPCTPASLQTERSGSPRLRLRARPCGDPRIGSRCGGESACRPTAADP